MPLAQLPNNEATILTRVLQPERRGLSSAAARAFLALDFTPADKERMRELSAKARAGALTPDEQTEINSYERIGHFLNILQSRARRTLKRGRGMNGKAKSR